MKQYKAAPIRTIILWIVGFLSMLLIGWATQIVGPFDKSRDLAHDCACLWSRLIIWLAGIKIELEGAENLDPGKPQVLMANHQGSFDIWAVSTALPVQFRWVVKKELFRIPALGGAMKAAGDISVDRQDPQAALKDLKSAMERIKAGRSIVIFPEGTRTLDGSVGEFKSGGFLLAYQTGAPILPVSIQGSFDIMPRNSLMIHPHPIKIKIHPPLPVENLSRADKKALPEKVRDIIVQDLKYS